MNNTIKIETGIKIPQRGPGLIDAFRLMKVGNSIVIDRSNRDAVTSSSRAAGIKVTSRQLEMDKSKVRVWRIE